MFNPRLTGTRTNPPCPEMHEYIGLKSRFSVIHTDKEETPEYKAMVERIKKVKDGMAALSDLFVNEKMDRKEFFSWKRKLYWKILEENRKNIKRYTV